MASSATVTRVIQTADSTEEVVVLTATDAEEYTSRKFSTIQSASASLNGLTGTAISVSFGAGTAAIHCSITDELVTLVLRGE